MTVRMYLYMYVCMCNRFYQGHILDTQDGSVKVGPCALRRINKVLYLYHIMLFHGHNVSDELLNWICMNTVHHFVQSIN